jgi:hypothetical protein
MVCLGIADTYEIGSLAPWASKDQEEKCNNIQRYVKKHYPNMVATRSLSLVGKIQEDDLKG